jgi:hypothetical protein
MKVNMNGSSCEMPSCPEQLSVTKVDKIRETNINSPCCYIEEQPDSNVDNDVDFSFFTK